MTEAAAINAVMRALADPTRRAVFERIVRSDEITVVELTRGSGVTQGAISQHLKSLKQAGLVAERPEGRNVYYRAQPEGPRAARRLDEPLRRLLARAVRQSPNPPEGDRSMNDAALKPDTQDIVVDEVFPHAPETIWKTLTTGELIGRWMMAPTGFEPVEGKRFTFQTTPAGAWDGIIHCQVLEVMPNERLVYAWKGGHEGNVGYGSRLDTVVTWILSRVENGTRLRLVHSGFVTAEERYCLQEHERRLEEGRPKPRRRRRGAGLSKSRTDRAKTRSHCSWRNRGRRRHERGLYRRMRLRRDPL